MVKAVSAVLYYLVVWWFKKTENKTSLIIRAILAGILGLSCLIAAIDMFKSEFDLVLSAIWGLIVSVLFLVKAILDIKKLFTVKTDDNKVPDCENKDFLSEYKDEK